MIMKNYYSCTGFESTDVHDCMKYPIYILLLDTLADVCVCSIQLLHILVNAILNFEFT